MKIVLALNYFGSEIRLKVSAFVFLLLCIWHFSFLYTKVQGRKINTTLDTNAKFLSLAVVMCFINRV